MSNHKRSKPGFTIVELLIVIVVIGILAAIVIVTYSNIQNKSKQVKTVTAVAAWVKAIRAYQLDNGWPTTPACLGNTNTYVGDSGKCWSNGSWTVSGSFNSLLQSRLGNSFPEPDTTYANQGTYTLRGARYNYDGTVGSIYYVLTGTNTCPRIGGLDQTLTDVYTNGVQCGGNIQSAG